DGLESSNVGLGTHESDGLESGNDGLETHESEGLGRANAGLGTHEKNRPNMFFIRIHHGGRFHKYPGRRYVDGHVDIFGMVDIDLFNVMMVIQLAYTREFEPMFYNYLRPMSTLVEGLYALACDEDIRCLETPVRSFKLVKVYIKHGFTAVNSYQRSDKILLLTWHDISTSAKESVCDSVTPKSMPQHDSSTPTKDSVYESVTPRCMLQHDSCTPAKDSVCDSITPRCMPRDNQVIEDVMKQLSFEEFKMDEEARFGDVAGSGIDSSGLRHNESFGVDDLDLNINLTRDLNVSQNETQEEELVSEVHVSEVPNEHEVNEPAEVGRTKEHVVEQGNGQEVVDETSGEQIDYDVDGIDIAYETQYHVESSEDACTNDDGDEDDDILVDEENDMVEPDVDVNLFSISKVVPFDNISVTSLVPNDLLEGEELNVVNLDCYDSDTSNDNETSTYMRRRLDELRREMEGVMNASGRWKYTFYIGQNFASSKEAKEIVYLHSIESKRMLKLYKNDKIEV
ncbi:hypothetical protein Tco_0986420, partial [Tanacetum coccineum]